MTSPPCEQVQLSLVAERDGEPPLVDSAWANAHAAACEECRRALAADAEVRVALQGKTRPLTPMSSAWPAVSSAIERAPGPGAGWQVFAGAAAVVATEVVVLGPAVGLGWAVRLAPLIVIALVFSVMRVNPFRVEPSLELPPSA